MCQMGDKCKLMNNIYISFCTGSLEINEVDEIFSDYDMDSDSDSCCVSSMPILEIYTQNIAAFIYGFLRENLKDDMMYVRTFSSFKHCPFSHKYAKSLMQYLFETQCASLCSEMLSDSKEELQVHLSTPLDCQAFSYCFMNSSCQWHLKIISAEHLETLNHCLMQCNRRIQGIILTIKIFGFQWDNVHLNILQRYMRPKYISELYLNKCSLKVSNCEALAEALHNFPNLKILDISENSIGPGGAVSLFLALQALEKLEHLNVTNTNLGVEDGKQLTRLIEDAPSLLKLSLGDSRYFSKSAKQFWSSVDFMAAVFPAVLTASNLIELTLVTGTCLSTSALMKLFRGQPRVRQLQKLHVESLYHPCECCIRNQAVLLSKMLPNLDSINSLERIGLCIHGKFPMIVNGRLDEQILNRDLDFQSESPFTIEESITLVNSAICLSNIKSNVILYYTRIAPAHKVVLSIDCLGFAVRRGCTALQIKLERFCLL